MPVTVLLGEDSEVMRHALRELLAGWAEIELVGEAIDFAQTIQMTKDLKPHVLLMDLHMAYVSPPCGNGHFHLGATQLLAMSLSNDDEAKLLAESLGAVLLLDKINLYDELAPAILQFAAPQARAAAGT